MALILNSFLAADQGQDEPMRGCRGERDGVIVMTSKHPTYEENNAEVLRVLLGAARVARVEAPPAETLSVGDVARAVVELTDLLAAHRHGGSPYRPTDNIQIQAVVSRLRRLTGAAPRDVPPDLLGTTRSPNPYEAGPAGRNPYEGNGEGE